MKDYKRKITQLKKLVTEARKNVYQRVKLCCEVFADMEYRGDIGIDADDEVAAELEKQFLGDLGQTFFTLQAVYNHFPSEEQWRDSTIVELVSAWDQYRREKEGRERKPRAERKAPVPHKVHEQLEKEKEWAESQVQSLRGETSALHEEVTRLRMENARLQGRIEELEKILESRAEFAAA